MFSRSFTYVQHRVFSPRRFVFQASRFYHTRLYPKKCIKEFHIQLPKNNNRKLDNMTTLTKARILSINNIISELNKGLEADRQLTVEKLMEQYGNVSEVMRKICDILKKHSKRHEELRSDSICEVNKSLLWTCNFTLYFPREITFKGIGISKKTAMYNSRLAAVLWLDEVYFDKKSSIQEKSLQAQFDPRNPFSLISGPDQINKKFLKKLLGPLQQSNFLGTRMLSTGTSNVTDANQKPKPDISEQSQLNTNNSTIKEVHFDQYKDVKLLHDKFPAPKNAFHNIFNILSTELKDKTLNIQPNYKLHKDKNASQWLCMYHVKWPEEIKFYAKAQTKQKASTLAALTALSWLLQNKNITNSCLPILHTKDEIKEVKTKTIPEINLTPSTLQKMNEIITLYEDNLLPHIKEKNIEIDGNNNEPMVFTKEPHSVDFNTTRQRFLGLNTYRAKEKVQLPVAKYKEDFIKLLGEHNIIIVKGEPGCGKSTRIPQYVLEAWAREGGMLGEQCRIAVTQPRRIAAISLAERVSSERNESTGHIVGYQVRLKSSFRSATGRVLYCTTGILLRHLQTDPTLAKFSHVIIDEAHERDVNTDLLLNLLRTSLKTNPKLKLIVMSATIDTDIFKEYFEGAPVMEIPGFTFPVEQHFLESLKNVDLSKTGKMCESQCPTVVHDDVVKVIKHIHRNKPEGAILVFLPGWEDISRVRFLLPQYSNEIVVHCLHSRLQDEEQWKIFSKPPPGVRKIILATNIAETSVTIDDVVYVVDSGIRKDQRFDVDKGINCIDNYWISKASATQRKGRAGRVQPGECFHLYTKDKYDTFEQYSLPEILCTSLTKIVLDSKVFSNNMDADQFMNCLLTPPDKNAIAKAVEELKDLELLDSQEKLTSLGKTLVDFQLEPKLAKALVNAVVFKCVTPVVDIITLFSSDVELFASGLVNKDAVKVAKKQFCSNSDHLALMRVFEKWLEYQEEGDTYTAERFCRELNLVYHKLETVRKLKYLHFDYLKNGLYNVMPLSDDCSDNDELVKAVIFSGVGTVLFHRKWEIVKNRLKNNVNVFLTRNNHKATITMDSVNFKRSKFPTDFLLYINETRSNIRRTTLVRECSLIPALSVLLFTNKDLQAVRVPQNNASDTKTYVKLRIENTNLEFICDNEQAQLLIKCKTAIMDAYQYWIYQLTHGGDDNPQVSKSWDKVLLLLDQLLSENKV